MTFEPLAAKEFIFTRLQSIALLDGWRITDEAVEDSRVVMVSMASPGAPDHVHGLTDGERTIADPLFLVVVCSPSETEAGLAIKEIDANLEGATGQVPSGYVQHVTRVNTTFSTENTATKKTKRYSCGAFYRVTVHS